MPTILRPMSTGELLDRTFFLYRRHFTLFVGIVALPFLATMAIQIAAVAVRPGVPGKDLAAFGAWWLGYSAVYVLVFMLALAASHAATVVAVSNVHLERDTTISAAFGAVKGRMRKLLLIMAGVWVVPVLLFAVPIAAGAILTAFSKPAGIVVMVVGILAAVVAALIIWLAWSLTIPVAVLEDKGFRASTRRSAQLTKGNRGRIFVLYFLFSVLTYVVSLLWELPLLVAFGASVMSRRTAPTDMPAWFQVISSVGTFATQSLVGPLLTIALSLIYYDERVRREGYDLQVMMASIATPPVADAEASKALT